MKHSTMCASKRRILQRWRWLLLLTTGFGFGLVLPTNKKHSIAPRLSENVLTSALQNGFWRQSCAFCYRWCRFSVRWASVWVLSGACCAHGPTWDTLPLFLNVFCHILGPKNPRSTTFGVHAVSETSHAVNSVKKP